MNATKAELDTIADVVSTLRTGPASVKKRLCRGAETILACEDGRYLEQLDIHSGHLERLADQIRKGVAV